MNGPIHGKAMTNVDTPLTTGARLVHLGRNWWPVPAFIALSVLVQTRFMSRYDVGGHAAEHLQSSTAPLMAAAVIGILVWATPGALRQADIMLAAIAWFATTVAVSVGNLRVVNQLVSAGYGFTPTSSVPDIADHSLANTSIWWAVAAAVVLVAAFRRRHHIGNTATAGACFAMIVPPWVIPGAGVIVLAVVRCALHAKERAARVVPH
jgi:hypothetical protein